MSMQEVLNIFAIRNSIQRLRLQVAILFAPMIKNLKIAELIILPPHTARLLWNSAIKSRFSISVFYQSSEKVVFYFYKKEALNKYLKQEKIQTFLSSYGYPTENIENMLVVLEKRMKQFYEKKQGFPHEIGIFLQYPLEDVRGFLENRGKNFLISGYWKVYYNPEGAKKIFRAYDKAKEEVISEILNGRTVRELLEENRIT